MKLIINKITFNFHKKVNLKLAKEEAERIIKDAPHRDMYYFEDLTDVTSFRL